ncbi:hypothetical protein EJ08DRAFT_653169 [Tothia fuscella]|uniref:BAH domain-containing protein n=1 Tax=Tothia fuscella TaxID=1048955 RepID=A0A9P4NI19_9PEZI|nr:hypothetical protein EJ08DRAFT_653169 [Tothia fuscella]
MASGVPGHTAGSLSTLRSDSATTTRPSTIITGNDEDLIETGHRKVAIDKPVNARPLIEAVRGYKTRISELESSRKKIGEKVKELQAENEENFKWQTAYHDLNRQFDDAKENIKKIEAKEAENTKWKGLYRKLVMEFDEVMAEINASGGEMEQKDDQDRSIKQEIDQNQTQPTAAEHRITQETLNEPIPDATSTGRGLSANSTRSRAAGNGASTTVSEDAEFASDETSNDNLNPLIQVLKEPVTTPRTKKRRRDEVDSAKHKPTSGLRGVAETIQGLVNYTSGHPDVYSLQTEPQILRDHLDGSTHITVDYSHNEVVIGDEWDILDEGGFEWHIVQGRETHSSPFDKRLDFPLAVKEAEVWDKMPKFDSLEAEGEVYWILSNAYVVVNDDGQNKRSELVQIVDIRGANPSHVYVQVHFYFRADHANSYSSALRDQLTGSEREVVATNHVQIVEARRLAGLADVMHWTEGTERPTQDHEWFWRQILNVEKQDVMMARRSKTKEGGLRKKQKKKVQPAEDSSHDAMVRRFT